MEQGPKSKRQVSRDGEGRRIATGASLSAGQADLGLRAFQAFFTTRHTLLRLPACHGMYKL